MVSCFKEASFSHREDLCGLLCGVFQTPERYIWLFLTSYLQVLVRLGRFGLLLCEAQAEAERSGAQQMPRTRSSGGAILHVVQILTMSGCKPMHLLAWWTSYVQYLVYQFFHGLSRVLLAKLNPFVALYFTVLHPLCFLIDDVS